VQRVVVDDHDDRLPRVVEALQHWVVGLGMPLQHVAVGAEAVLAVADVEAGTDVEVESADLPLLVIRRGATNSASVGLAYSTTLPSTNCSSSSR
jgi:hypothetical protein